VWWQSNLRLGGCGRCNEAIWFGVSLTRIMENALSAQAKNKVSRRPCSRIEARATVKPCSERGSTTTCTRPSGLGAQSNDSGIPKRHGCSIITSTPKLFARRIPRTCTGTLSGGDTDECLSGQDRRIADKLISSSHGYKREKVTVQHVKFLLMIEALISNVYVKIFR